VAELQVRMDAERFAVLYDRYSAKVFQKCVGMTRDRHLAKDLTHDIFVKAFLSLPKFDGRSRFGTWLYSITYNYCLDHLRRSQRIRSEDIDKRGEDDLPPDDTTERQLMGMTAEGLQLVLERLTPDDRALLLMKYQDEIPVVDIQRVLDLSESAVKMRLLRARERALEHYRNLYNEGA
jgi:RNA polymerase sigma factor (sigma-70 family)